MFDNNLGSVNAVQPNGILESKTTNRVSLRKGSDVQLLLSHLY